MIVTEEEYKKADKKELEKYCNWCWLHDYGNCGKCAIGKRNE